MRLTALVAVTERYTSVWQRQDGRWRVRHEHTSMVPTPDAPQDG